MASSIVREAQLIIRARDEASVAARSIAQAMEGLAQAQADVARGGTATSSGLSQMAGILGALEQVALKTGQAVDRSADAFQRQQSSLSGNEAKLVALKAQYEAAAQAIVNLNIKAREGGAIDGQLSAARAAYQGLGREIQQTEKQITKQRLELDASANALTETQNAAIAAGIAVNSFGNDGARSTLKHRAAVESLNAELREEERLLKQTAVAAEAAAAAQTRINREYAPGLGRDVKSARDSASVFASAPTGVGDLVLSEGAQVAQQRALATQKEMASAAAQLRAQLNPLAASQDQYNREIETLTKLQKAGLITSKEFAEGQKLAAARAEEAAEMIRTGGKGANGRVSLFGLKPYELTNLGYQVNDVITQIASGTPIMQVFAQQGGQIIQLIPKLQQGMLGLLRNPVFLTIAAGVTVLTVAMGRLSDAQSRLRSFDALLDIDADGARYSTAALEELTKSIRDYGVSADEAAKMARSFVTDGIDPSRFDQLALAAQNTAIVMGGELSDAMDDVREGFSGSFEAIEKLDEKYNFLSAAQLDYIRTLFEQNDAQDAVTFALNTYAQKMADTAARSESDWSKAVRNLSSAWSGLLDRMANTAPIQIAINKLQELSQFLNLISGNSKLPSQVTSMSVGALDLVIGKANTGLSNLETKLASLKKTQREGGMLVNQDRISADIVKTIREIEKAKTIIGQLDKQRKERAGLPGTTPANTAATERQKKDEADLLRIGDQRLAVAKGLTAEQRLQNAYDTALKEAQGKKVSAAAAELYANKARAAEQAKIDKENAKEAERAANKRESEAERLAKAKKREDDRRKEAQSDFNRDIDQEEASRQRAIEALAKQNGLHGDALLAAEKEAAVQEAITRAKDRAADKDVTISPEQIKAIRESTERYEDLKQAAEKARNAEEAAMRPVDDLGDLRDSLLTQIEFYERMGQTDMADQLREQLGDVEGSLLEARDAAIAYWEAIKGDPTQMALLDTTPEKIDTIINSLKRVTTHADELRTQFVMTSEQMKESFADNATNALDQFSQKVANGANVFKSLGSSIMQTAAIFLREIAQMIIKQQIFNALQGGGGGGGIFGMILKSAISAGAGSIGGGAGGSASFIQANTAAGFATAHTGGIAGQLTGSKLGFASWFDNAKRYHGGGIPGLAPNEIPIIVEEGEEILTRSNPRHALNGGGGAPPKVDVQVVNTLDPAEILSKALSTRQGQKTFLNFMAANSRAASGALGGGN